MTPKEAPAPQHPWHTSENVPGSLAYSLITAWGSNRTSEAPEGGSEWAKLAPGAGRWPTGAFPPLPCLTPPSALPLTYQGTGRCCRT